MTTLQKFFRIFISMLQFRTLKNKTQNLAGKTYLITGAARGIGAELTRNLALQNAEVLLCCRNPEQGKQLKNKILLEKPDASIQVFANADTANLESMKQLAAKISEHLQNKALDGLVLNAGIAGVPYAVNTQQHELHVATNVLGHHLLAHKLLPQLVKSNDARIIYVTGDIYVLANNCTLDFKYTNKQAGLAYARSKLGVSWNALSMQELLEQKNLPIKSIAVHPGVVQSDLINTVAWIKKLILISPVTSARTLAYALTEKNVGSGDYLHNVRGKMHLPKNDPALNDQKRRIFWEECNRACGIDIQKTG